MPGKKPARKKNPTSQPDASEQSQTGEEALGEEYRLMMELDSLETLREEMEERGLSTLAEIGDRIRELNEQLDKIDQASEGQ